MKSTRFFYIVMALLLCLVSCENNSNVQFTGSESFTFNGLEIERLPLEGMGRYGVTPSSMEYRWKGCILTITDNGDATFTISSPKVSGQLVKSKDKISFDDEGALIDKPQ